MYYKKSNATGSCVLLDFAAFINVFYKKKRFSHFKKAFKKQKLLCGSGTILIKDWYEIFLPFKVENQTSIFVLKNITYISNFSINFVLLSILADDGFK